VKTKTATVKRFLSQQKSEALAHWIRDFIVERSVVENYVSPAVSTVQWLIDTRHSRSYSRLRRSNSRIIRM